MAGVFEHLAAFDDSERVAARQAVAVARKRVETQFGPFLANAAAGDHAARLALIEGDINAVVASVVAEYGGDYDKIRKVIADWTSIPRDTAGQWTSPEQLQEGQQDDIDSELAKAPSAVGEDAGAGVLSSRTAGHAADCECGFCKNKGKLPGSFDDDDDEEESEEKTGRTAGDPLGDTSNPANAEAAGNLEGKHQFKDDQRMRGEEAANPAFEVTPALPEHCDALQNDGQQYLDQGIPLYTVLKNGQPHAMFDESGTTIGNRNSPASPQAQELAAPYQARTAAPTPEGAGGAVKREDLPKADASGLGGPSPKIDKGKSGDENGWNLKPIDTQTKGTPHPTVDQDVTQKPEYDKDDFLAQTDSVTNSVELDTADDWGAGFASGGEEHGPNTDTWTEGQNDPVTSDRGEGVLSATDPDKNPISEIMSSWEDDHTNQWADDRTVQAAIWQYDQGESSE